MNIFDIFIAYVTWGGVANEVVGGKKRPVLILEQTAGGVIVFKITAQYDGKSELVRSKYFQINNWQQAGLNQQSYIDTNSTVTLPLSSVDLAHPLGTLTESDVQKLIEFISK
jgi:mRNA-degrading endonuclease toxin of MazEF toxin-antitoxin module